MSWKEVLIMEERCRFVLLAAKKDRPFSVLCREYGVSRTAGYKWVARYKKYGLKSLGELSRRPLGCKHKTSKKVEKLILNIRRKHSTWGPKKIRDALMKDYAIGMPPAVSTIGSILKRNGVSLRKRRDRGVYRLAPQDLTEPTASNDVWTVDFKGWYRTKDGQRCDPLTVMDLHSRYLLCTKLVRATTVRVTKSAFKKIFRKYGLPRVIRVDNGSPFASMGIGRLSELSVWWTHLGIRVEFIEPGHPEQNGSHERMHETMKAETTRPVSANPMAQQQRLNRWRKEYNEDRPHESLKMQRPAQIYHPSPRRFTGKIKPLHYPRPLITVQLSSGGFLSWKGKNYFVGEALAGSRLGLKRLDKSQYEVYFSTRLIGELHEAATVPGRLRPPASAVQERSRRSKCKSK